MAKRKRDYYEVLGVQRSASEADIKRAFRELARQHHPDVNPAGGEAFREINEAYAVLSDKDARTRYDRWGHADDGGSGFGAVVDAAQEMINDVLRRARRGREKGRDLRYTLEVTFEEAAFGASKTIQFESESKQRELAVVVPAGTKDGAVKQYKGEGDPGKGGGAPGDLHVIVRVAEHATFRRDDRPQSFFGTAIVLGLAIVANWVAFGGGERRFTTTTSINGTVVASRPVSERSGRFVFGVGAVILDGVLVVLLIRRFR